MNKYASFSNKLFSNYVNMTYSEFSNRNTANMTKVIITEASQLSFLIQSILIMFSEMLVVIILYALLLTVDVQMTLVLTIILGVKVFFLLKTVSKKIKHQGFLREV